MFRITDITDWTLIYFQETELVFCIVSDPGLDITVLIFGSIPTLMNYVVNLIILYMFIKGLWSLNNRMMKQFLEKHIEIQHMDSNTPRTPTPTPTSPEAEENELHRLPSKSKSKSTPSSSSLRSPSLKKGVSLEIVLEKYNSIENRSGMSSEVKRIINLYNVMKKQTILACVAIFSTFGFQLFITIDPAKASPVFSYDIIVNAFCIWLAFGCMDKYWVFCTKYGFCKCCYMKKTDVSD